MSKGPLPALLLLIGGAAAVAQAPSFEVASIKVNRSGVDGRNPPMARFQPGGRWTVTNMTLLALVRNSYRLMDFQVTGGPDWIDRERYDILAKAHDAANADEMRLMARTLFADRFKLVTRFESREQPIYRLVVARSGARLGSGLRTNVECGGVSSTVSTLAPPAQCGFLGQGPSSVSFKGVPIDAFARSALSMRLGRYVENRTGLPGYYDIDLNWTPGPEEAGPPVAREPRAGDAGDGPSLFTALEEQLGLKLESARGSVEILVITSAERPTPD